MQTKNAKFYNAVRPSNPNGNIQVVFDLTIMIFSIGDGEVLLETTPNVTGYNETRTSQSIDYERTDESAGLRLRLGGPSQRVRAGDSSYDIAVDSIGEETLDGLKTTCCVLSVTQID